MHCSQCCASASSGAREGRQSVRLQVGRTIESLAMMKACQESTVSQSECTWVDAGCLAVSWRVDQPFTLGLIAVEVEDKRFVVEHAEGVRTPEGTKRTLSKGNLTEGPNQQTSLTTKHPYHSSRPTVRRPRGHRVYARPSPDPQAGVRRSKARQCGSLRWPECR